jgi:hypothetical protein
MSLQNSLGSTSKICSHRSAYESLIYLSSILTGRQTEKNNKQGSEFDPWYQKKKKALGRLFASVYSENKVWSYPSHVTKAVKDKFIIQLRRWFYLIYCNREKLHYWWGTPQRSETKSGKIRELWGKIDNKSYRISKGRPSYLGICEGSVVLYGEPFPRSIVERLGRLSFFYI